MDNHDENDICTDALPQRRHDCAHYDECLSAAAFANSGMDCSQCERFQAALERSGGSEGQRSGGDENAPETLDLKEAEWF